MLSLGRNEWSMITDYLSPVERAYTRSTCVHLYRVIVDEAIAIRWFFDNAMTIYTEDAEKEYQECRHLCGDRIGILDFYPMDTELLRDTISNWTKMLYFIGTEYYTTHKHTDYYFCVTAFKYYWNLRTVLWEKQQKRLMRQVLDDKAPIEVVTSLWLMLDLSEDFANTLIIEYDERDDLYDWLRHKKRRKKKRKKR